jgi:serine/threonine protein kinase
MEQCRAMAERTHAGPPPEPIPIAGDGSPRGLRVGGFVIEGEIHVRPSTAGRPFVILGENWAWKAYRISELDQLGMLGRVRREAEIALELDAVNGVVGAAEVNEAGDWLVLRMRKMTSTFADHLSAREERQEKALDPSAYANLLRDVGETLRAIHRRGVLHRDIKPANLLFDSERRHLYVCDFSVARIQRSDLTHTGETLGTDSYIAPERWQREETTPASDQYSLGMVAREAFTGRDSPPLPLPLAQALRTATSVDPEDRFPGIDGCRDFGLALERAVQKERPRTLADRLRDASPATRYAWAPAFLAIAILWIQVILDRHAEMVVGLETLLLPVVGGLTCFVAMRFFNLPRGRRRTQSGARLLDMWWTPWLIVAAFLFLGHGAHGIQVPFLLAIPFGFAFAGAYPQRCGYWLPATIERSGRAIAERQLLRPLRPLRARIAAVAAALTLIAFLPIWIEEAFPAPYTGPTGWSSAALVAVKKYRSAVLRRDVEYACAITGEDVKTSSPCPRWTQVQVLMARASQERARSRAGERPVFDDVPLSEIHIEELGTDAEERVVYLLGFGGAPPGSILTFGSLIIDGGEVDIVLTEGPPVSPQDFEHEAALFYELRQESTFWKVQFTNVCSAGGMTVEGTASNQCLSAMRLSPAAITKLLAEN